MKSSTLQKKARIVIILLSWNLASNLISKEVLFEDNFEEADAISQPSDEDAHPSALVGKWSLLKIGQDNQESLTAIQVVNNPQPGTRNGKNYLAIEREKHSILWAKFAKESTEEYLSISFQIYVPKSSDPYASPRFGLKSDVKDVHFTENVIFSHSLLANGQVRQHSSTGEFTTLGKFTLDKWISVRYDVNFDKKKYALTIDGNTYNNIDLGTDHDRAAQFLWYVGAAKGRFFLDEVLIMEDSVDKYPFTIKNTSSVSVPIVT